VFVGVSDPEGEMLANNDKLDVGERLFELVRDLEPEGEGLLDCDRVVVLVREAVCDACSGTITGVRVLVTETDTEGNGEMGLVGDEVPESVPVSLLVLEMDFVSDSKTVCVCVLLAVSDSEID